MQWSSFVARRLAAALGDAYSALASDSYAPVWNPAGLGFLKTTELAMMHLSSPSSVSYGAYSLAYGQTLGDKLSVGATGKLISADIGGVPAPAWALDLGGMCRPNEQWSLAVVLGELGTTLTFLNQPDSPPTGARLGRPTSPARNSSFRPRPTRVPACARAVNGAERMCSPPPGFPAGIGIASISPPSSGPGNLREPRARRTRRISIIPRGLPMKWSRVRGIRRFPDPLSEERGL
jgi:hypothetical protein